MDLSPRNPLKIRELARYLNVEVVAADELVDHAGLKELERIQPGAFSAATFHLPDGRTVTVCSPCSDPGRTNSDIAHELAHILLMFHDVRELQQLAGHTFPTCDPEQEAEANWPCGCLLLPRQLLLREVYADATAEDPAAKYEVPDCCTETPSPAASVSLAQEQPVREVGCAEETLGEGSVRVCPVSADRLWQGGGRRARDRPSGRNLGPQTCSRRAKHDRHPEDPGWLRVAEAPFVFACAAAAVGLGHAFDGAGEAVVYPSAVR
jgi:hypothetical protein